MARSPTFQAWLQDGLALAGATPERQAQWRASAERAATRAVEGLEAAEGAVIRWEAALKARLAALREPTPPPKPPSARGRRST